MVSQELLDCQEERDSLKSQLETWKERAEALQDTLKTQSKVKKYSILFIREKNKISLLFLPFKSPPIIKLPRFYNGLL
jgi:hypothetical protein